MQPDYDLSKAPDHVCAHCGHRWPGEREFCPNCGKRQKGKISFQWTCGVVALVILATIFALVGACCLVTVLQDPKNEYVGIPMVIGTVALVLLAIFVIGAIAAGRRKE